MSAITTFEQGKDKVAGLCRHYEINQLAYKADGVKEAHVRLSLIDPLFEALGWDVSNKAMHAPQYREVITEDSLEIEGQQKAPDYTFRVGTLAKFYTEAKKCTVNIGSSAEPANQLRRYGFSAKLAISILTNFEKFSVYDCTQRPKVGDRASIARILHISHDEYPDRWRELWDVYSRDAVWNGSFDQFATSKRKRGTSEVDKEFLKDIEYWRDVLARNIALRNRDISTDDLNESVQRIIDRIIFLRMAEDRNLEPQEQLLNLCVQPNIFKRFISDLCSRADDKYNSGLFHFRKEENTSELPDRITPRLIIDDRVFKPILQSLYYEQGCPYHFGVLPVEILGTVYERFLGKVIRLTSNHQAKVEEKPEVRKAGGVYYTPAYIVNYIVQNTVGKLIEGKSPAQLASEKNKEPFRVLDPACGSGSFLIGAYQCLLDHCLHWYEVNKPEKHKKAVFKDAKGAWRLSINERKRILTTHIFGVDIDRQAVEVTKLSLLLKALEGENDASLTRQMQMFKERALPNLADNIKCGNSLIGPDYFTKNLLPDPEELKRVNPFDWKNGFPDAMKAGGFDCVIGNPPYVYTRDKGFTADEKNYFTNKFKHNLYQLNSYVLFTEQAIGLLKENGHLGFIIPNNWLSLVTMKSFRDFLVGSTSDLVIVNNLYKVFEGANVDTSIITLIKAKKNEVCLIESAKPLVYFEIAKVKALNLLMEPIIQFKKHKNISSVGLTRKIELCSAHLEEYATVKAGLQAYEVGKGEPKQTKTMRDERIYHSNQRIDNSYSVYLEGCDVRRYSILWSGNFIKYGSNLAAPRKPELFSGERILIRQIPSKPPYLINGALVDGAELNDRNSMIVKSKSNVDIHFLLAILNSRLVSYWFNLTFDKLQRGIFPQFKVKELAEFPICSLDFTNSSDKARHDRMIFLAKSMLTFHKQLAAANSERKRTSIERQIKATDIKIDKLVYELYGLTEEEIKIVEGE